MYRASRDGFSSKNFHSKCDNMESTLTVIKSESGNVFGGYTDKAWDSNGRGVTDPNAFFINYKLFYLHIVGDSNTNESSYSNFGNSYKHPDYPAGTEEAQNILAGSYKFKTTEIEIYTKVN